MTRNVAGWKGAEEALRKSEENLAEAQRMVHLGSWELDVKTCEVSWSDEVFRICGYAPGEFVPTLDKFMEIVHPDDREPVSKALDISSTEVSPTPSNTT